METKQKRFLYRYSRYIKLIFLFWDVILLNIAFLLSFLLRYGDFVKLSNQEAQNVIVISNLVWLGLVLYIGEYKFIRIEHIEKIISKSIKIVALHLVLVFTVTSFLNFDDVSRLRMLYFYGIFFLEIFIFRIVFIQILKYFRKQGYNFRRVVIIGAGQTGQEINNVLKKDLAYGYRVMGYFDDMVMTSNSILVLGKIPDIQKYVLENSIHEIYVTIPDYDESKIRELATFCERNMVRIKFVPDFKKYTDSKKVHIDFYESIPVISLRKEPLETPLNRIMKRFFDYVFSFLLILLIFPWLFPILMILVKVSSRGPIFFRQQRSGENNRIFYCWKFRTMRVNNLSDELQATKNDVRITAIGKFMRKTNLDELPQFFNVIAGHMSVVGPRPHMLKHTEKFSAIINNYLVRHYTRPGITGWAQVNGYRGETKELKDLKMRIEYDIWYIENWSFLLDMKIIFNTVMNMFYGEKNAG